MEPLVELACAHPVTDSLRDLILDRLLLWRHLTRRPSKTNLSSGVIWGVCNRIQLFLKTRP